MLKTVVLLATTVDKTDRGKQRFGLWTRIGKRLSRMYISNLIRRQVELCNPVRQDPFLPTTTLNLAQCAPKFTAENHVEHSERMQYLGLYFQILYQGPTVIHVRNFELGLITPLPFPPLSFPECNALPYVIDRNLKSSNPRIHDNNEQRNSWTIATCVVKLSGN